MCCCRKDLCIDIVCKDLTENIGDARLGCHFTYWRVGLWANISAWDAGAGFCITQGNRVLFNVWVPFSYFVIELWDARKSGWVCLYTGSQSHEELCSALELDVAVPEMNELFWIVSYYPSLNVERDIKLRSPPYCTNADAPRTLPNSKKWTTGLHWLWLSWLEERWDTMNEITLK